MQRRLAAGEFVVTSEISHPLSFGTNKLIRDIEATPHYVTALNCTDTRFVRKSRTVLIMV